ncbi:MAG: hypothetical protein ACKOGI_01965 [Vulcanococcus sp.]
MALAACLMPAALRAAPAAEPLPEAELLEHLRGLGVRVDIRAQCGAQGQLAIYNMGANWLCLNQGLSVRPAERSRVLHHELVHVVQDCLDGLDTPTSSTLAEGFRRDGSLSGDQINGFFLRHLQRQNNLEHVVASTALLPQESRQREIEAYALQSDPALVQRLLLLSCRP